MFVLLEEGRTKLTNLDGTGYTEFRSNRPSDEFDEYSMVDRTKHQPPAAEQAAWEGAEKMRQIAVTVRFPSTEGKEPQRPQTNGLPPQYTMWGREVGPLAWELGGAHEPDKPTPTCLREALETSLHNVYAYWERLTTRGRNPAGTPLTAFMYFDWLPRQIVCFGHGAGNPGDFRATWGILHPHFRDGDEWEQEPLASVASETPRTVALRELTAAILRRIEDASQQRK